MLRWVRLSAICQPYAALSYPIKSSRVRMPDDCEGTLVPGMREGSDVRSLGGSREPALEIYERGVRDPPLAFEHSQLEMSSGERVASIST